VRLRSVVGAGDALVLVLDLAAGGSLARLLAARGRLGAGEVVTVAVPLAQALADVHGRGLVHGDVTPANVLFTSDGRPLLSDLGVARLLGAGEGDPSGTAGFVDPAVAAGGAPGPASDVHGLAATCLVALTGFPAYDGQGARVPADPHHPVVTALERALDPDPDARPSAAELARAVWESAPAEPVRLACEVSALGPDDVAPPVTHRVVTPRPPADGPDVPAARRGGGSRRGVHPPRWRPALTVLLGATALAMAAVTGIAWAGAGAGSRPGGVRPAAGTAAASSSWETVLGRLDAARSRAFGRGAVGGLAEVYLDGSPASGRDRAALARLQRAGLRADGLRLETRSVTELARAGDEVRLRVVDEMSPYRLVDSAGTVVDERPGRGAARWTVTLRRSGGRWRVYDVARG
jgi:hypothetical protein